MLFRSWIVWCVAVAIGEPVYYLSKYRFYELSAADVVLAALLMLAPLLVYLAYRFIAGSAASSSAPRDPVGAREPVER